MSALLGPCAALALLAGCDSGDDAACAPLQFVPVLNVHVSGGLPDGYELTLACEEERQCERIEGPPGAISYTVPTQADSVTVVVKTAAAEDAWSKELPLDWQDQGDGCVAKSMADITVDAVSFTVADQA
jgi:hypothetical protein